MREPNGLLHLGDLAFPEDSSADSRPGGSYDRDVLACTGRSLLADEDRISLNQLAPAEVQHWCISRITEYQNRNRILRQQYGSAARGAISRNKSHIRALRSAYNGAAPINRCLPPEVLMEVFSHVHPAVMSRPHVPVLRVCRYWRQLVLKTSHFWANLLSLPTWKTWNPEHHMRRFRATLARSASVNLDLFVPYYSQDIIDTLMPHVGRISSFTVGPTLYDFHQTAQVRIEQRMPCPTHRLVAQLSWRYTSTLTFDFLLYPNVRSLELQHTYFRPLAAPYPSLRHLRLDHCATRPSETTSDGVPPLYAVHNTFELFPNLETLSLTCSLSDIDRDELELALPVPELTKTVRLPHLRLLELKDVSDYITEFISHLDFPSTTALVLEPSHTDNLAHLPTAIPLPAGFTPSPAPDTELSLLLAFNRDAGLVRWETHGTGVRPVRITLPGGTSNAPTIAWFSHALVAVLAPAPARGLTTLTAVGSGAWTTDRYWDDLLPALPALRGLAYDAGGCEDTWMLIYQLKKITASGCACPALEDVRLEWYLPRDVDYGSGPGEGRGGEGGGDWEALWERDDGGPRGRGDREERLLASLCRFSDMVRECLVVRASDEGGRCGRLRRLEVRACVSRFDAAAGAVLQGWQAALVEARLRDRLGEFVKDIVVVGGVQ